MLNFLFVGTKSRKVRTNATQIMTRIIWVPFSQTSSVFRNIFLMPFNIPGILVPFQLIYRPSLLIPSLVINGCWQAIAYAPFCSTDWTLTRKTSVSLTFLHCTKLDIEVLSSIKITAWWAVVEVILQNYGNWSIHVSCFSDSTTWRQPSTRIESKLFLRMIATEY